jgi:hypothetical protein
MPDVPARRPSLWLVLGGLLAVTAIAALWPLREVGQICAAIYPPPPGCGATAPLWAPVAGIALIVAVFAGMVVVFATTRAPRVPLIVLCGAIVGIALLAAAIVAISQTGIWDAPIPIIID